MIRFRFSLAVLQYVQISGKCNFSNPTLSNFSMDWAASGVRGVGAGAVGGATGSGNGGVGGGEEETPFVHMLTTHEFEFEPVHTLLRPPPRVRTSDLLYFQAFI